MIPTTCQQYLQTLFQDSEACITPNNLSKNNIPETYGEILFTAMKIILTHITINETDVFYDLGSGLGKIVLQVFLETKVKKSIGIEILPILHQQALSATIKLKQDQLYHFENNKILDFKLGSFFELPIPDATILLLSSPCFSPNMLFKLGNMINNLPNVHTVISLRPLPTLQRLKFKQAVRIECSWDSALCYIYGHKALTV